MIDLSGKTAVITGAGSGVGKAITLALARHGCTVVAVGRRRERLEQVIGEVPKHNHTAAAPPQCGPAVDGQASAGADIGALKRGQAIPCDVTDKEAVAELKEEVVRRAGHPDIVINGAGYYGEFTLVRESDPDRWMKTLAVNLFGPYLVSRIFTQGMIDRGWGRIINISSAASLNFGPVNSAYALSKASLNHFTRQLANEVAGTGVTANVIHPGEVKTDMWQAIKNDASHRGPEAEGIQKWYRWVEETGGDPPEKAADLVLDIIDNGEINGKFLWIKDGLQKPSPSWD